MRIFIVALIIISSLYADEMQRIENIVNDISKLRVDYEECQKQLSVKDNGVASFKAQKCDCSDVTKILEVSLEDEKQKNALLLQELETLKSFETQNEKLAAKIEELEENIKIQYSVLNTKDEMISKLELETIDLKKRVAKEKEKHTSIAKSNNEVKKVAQETVVVKEIEKVVCEEPKETNIFPKLVMKNEIKTQKVETKIQKVEEKVETITQESPEESLSKEEIVSVEASAYRFKRDAKIYDDINGVEQLSWNEGTSFTSNVRSENWIKITGYFVEKQWLPAVESMWVKNDAVVKR